MHRAHLFFLLLSMACATASPLAPTPVKPPARKIEPQPYIVTRAACPRPARPISKCGLESVAGERAPLLRHQRLTCEPQQRRIFMGIGSNTAIVANGALLRLDGTNVPVPDGVEGALLVDGQVVGITGGPDGQAFWRAGVCEQLSDGGHFVALLPLDDGSIVATVYRNTADVDVLQRLASGEWLSWGTLPAGLDAHAVGTQARIAFAYREGDRLGFSAPDLARSAITSRSPSSVAAFTHTPLSPIPGSRCSSTAVMEYDRAKGTMAVQRPRERRIEVPILTLQTCVERDGARTPFAFAGSTAFIALGERLLLAWVEQRGTCVSTREQAETHCAQGQPCREPEVTWRHEMIDRHTELVLTGVGTEARELSRIPFEPRTDSASWADADLVALENTVAVQAWNHLFTFDRVALEERIR